MLFVNVPFSAVALVGAFAASAGPERIRFRLADFDALGAVLVTGGMLLLVYALVKAPDVGWGATRTIAALAGAAVLLAAFVVNELRVANPLVPLRSCASRASRPPTPRRWWPSAGFLPMFFFLTLYMQTVLDYSPIQTGVAYLPLTGGFIISAGISSQLFARDWHQAGGPGRPRVAAGGLYWLSRIPVDGSYCRTSCPGSSSSRSALGAVFTGATTAANAGVDQDQAGLAAGLLNTGQQLGTALGLAILSALATARTGSLLHTGHVVSSRRHTTDGYQRALMIGACLVFAAAKRPSTLLARNTQQTTPVDRGQRPVLDLAA